MHELPDRRTVLVAVRSEHLGVERGCAGLQEHATRIGQLGEDGRQLDVDHVRPGIVELLEDALDVPLRLRLCPLERGADHADPAGRDGEHVTAVPGQHALQQCDVRHGPGHRPGMVEPVRQRHDAVEWHGAVGALQADDSAVGGRAEDRANGLGADRGRDHPGRDGCRRPRRRPAGRVLERPGIARGRRIAVGELGCLGLAKDDRAGGPKSRDECGVGRREGVGECSRPGRGGHARDIDDVLDPDRHAVERPERPRVADVRVAVGSLGQGCRRVQMCPRLDRGLERLDPRQARLGERDRGPLAELDALGGLDHPRVGRPPIIDRWWSPSGRATRSRPATSASSLAVVAQRAVWLNPQSGTRASRSGGTPAASTWSIRSATSSADSRW